MKTCFYCGKEFEKQVLKDGIKFNFTIISTARARLKQEFKRITNFVVCSDKCLDKTYEWSEKDKNNDPFMLEESAPRHNLRLNRYNWNCVISAKIY